MLPHEAGAFGPDVLFSFIGLVDALSIVRALFVSIPLDPMRLSRSKA